MFTMSINQLFGYSCPSLKCMHVHLCLKQDDEQSMSMWSSRCNVSVINWASSVIHSRRLLFCPKIASFSVQKEVNSLYA